MAGWTKIKEGIGSMAGKAKKRTGELMDEASMQLKLKALDSRKKKLYEQLGRLTYRQLKSQESQAEKISDTIAAIDRTRAKEREISDALEAAKLQRAAEKAAAKEAAFEDESEETVEIIIEE